jgi:streptomycin 6-kinase
MLDIPDEVRNKVIADGNAAWLDEVPSVVASLAQDWSLTIGTTLRDIVAGLWRPVSPDVDRPTGADKASEYSDLLPRLWEETGQACSEATVEDALACMQRRRRAHDDRHAVLVHGDVHELNVFQAADGAFQAHRSWWSAR